MEDETSVRVALRWVSSMRWQTSEISGNSSTVYYTIKRYRHPAKRSVACFLFIPAFSLFLAIGFVHRVPPSELTCVEFVLALPPVILKSFSEKTRPLRSIMFLIWRANSLWSMNSVSEDSLKGKLTKFPFYDFYIFIAVLCSNWDVIVHFKPLLDIFHDECQMSSPSQVKFINTLCEN